jgi:hypothetical protein
MQTKPTGLVADTGGPRARRTDPDTSHLAAEGADLEGSQAVVRAVLEYAGPDGLTDEEIAEGARQERFLAIAGRRYSQSRLRTARVELVELGVVVDAGQTRRTYSGYHARVWMLERFEEETAA